MIESIFLDAGGVILDESNFEIAKAEIITHIINKCKCYNINEYWNDTNEAVFRFVSSTYEYVLYKNINNHEECKNAIIEFKTIWKELKMEYKPMIGLEELLMSLSKNYKIGILGQYDASLVEFLKNEKIDIYFSFMETQEKYKTTKPDPRYYLEILKNANMKPENCIMIGDRIDKDIYPANVINMKNIRIRTGIHKNQEPRVFIEIPNYTVESLSEITDELIEEIDRNGFNLNQDLWKWKNLTTAST